MIKLANGSLSKLPLGSFANIICSLSMAFVMVTVATAPFGKVLLESKSVMLKQGTSGGQSSVPLQGGISHSTNSKTVPRVDCSCRIVI